MMGQTHELIKRQGKITNMPVINDRCGMNFLAVVCILLTQVTGLSSPFAPTYALAWQNHV
jgi:hypothetical protein